MDVFIGTIIQFGGNFAPRNWAFCNGQLLAISSNEALFSILGTTYGGDGRTTFGLPDFRGRTALHAGNGPGLSDRKLGGKSGTEINTINTTQLASHNHSAAGKIKVNSIQTDTSTDPKSFAAPSYYQDGGGRGTLNLYSTSENAFGAADGATISVGNNGGNLSVNNLQPFLCVSWIIAVQGTFPSRS